MAEYPAAPRKREPTHPGRIVASALDRLGVSIREAAAAIGVSHGALTNVVAGKAAMSPDMALRIGAYLGNGAEMWLGLQADYDLWHARIALKDKLPKIKAAEAA